MRHPRLYPVRLSHVPVIVKSPHHHVMLANERFFGGQHRVVLLFQLRRSILVTIESRLMSDDQILSRRRRSLRSHPTWPSS